jgi:homoserine O-acetyltransferase
MDALMPLASLPVAIAGRNRMMRKMAIDLVKMDPAWKNGEYAEEPQVGLTGAISSPGCQRPHLSARRFKEL